MRRRQAGFTFIEVLVVMGIIVVLMGMVAVLVPTVQEKGKQTDSMNNVRNMAQIMTERSIGKGWPKLSGKNFILSLVAKNVIDPDNPDNLRVYFSPGDPQYKLDETDASRYKEITMQTLKAQNDYRELTSYAARRNADPEHMLTSNKLRKVVPIICDDDDGPCHHVDGLVIAYSDGKAKFVEWEELGMDPPEDPDLPDPFLGDDASADQLTGLSSE